MRYLRAGILFLIAASCQQMELADLPLQDGRQELNISGVVNQEYNTRADDNGFATGDRMGVYIIDYDGETPGAMDSSGHRASNMIYTYNAEDNSWNNPTTLYWKDAVTPIDVYGYYPGVDHIDKPSEYSFEVAYRQDLLPTDGSVSAYESSDFLWAKAEKVAPTSEVIVLNYTHRMAGVKVSLIKGTGMTDAEWAAATKSVQVDNVVRHAVIDLSEGTPMPYGGVDKSILMLPQSGDVYRAVVVPQTVDAGISLLSITINGITYTHALTSAMIYKSGKLHNFNITVNRKEVSGDYQCSLSYEGITAWVNDEVSHDFTSNSYITVNVAEAGTLEQVISDKGVDPADIENLKLKGNLNEMDFEYIRNRMSGSLRRINLSEAKFIHVLARSYWSNEEQRHIDEYYDDYLPNNAFENMSYLRQVVLPDDLKRIGTYAFTGVELTSTLFLPEGVTHLYDHAFEGTICNIELPYSLEYIGEWVFASNQVDGVLVTGELRLTDNLKHIGSGAFWRARNFTGTFYLPSNLEYLGESAFESCGTDLMGDIIIPSTLTAIPAAAFQGMGFANGTNLIMHDGITKINDSAFAGTRIKNSIEWPKNLRFIEKNAFLECRLNIENLKLPSSVKKIATGAFMQNNITGDLEMPDNMDILDGGGNNDYGVFAHTSIESVVVGDSYIYLGTGAFVACSRLQKVYLGKNIDYIGSRALARCESIQTIVCMSEDPPFVEDDAFFTRDYGAISYYDKCILQVPEKSVEKYRNAEVWNQFKNITAYKELAFNVSEIVTMDKGSVRKGIIRAEGPWEVVDCPSWVNVSPSSGQGKAEVTVTVDAQSVGDECREGRIVFSLKEKDYTTYTDVRQVGAGVGEDQTVILQEASAGASKAIPLFIVGEGYDADDIASGKYLSDMVEQMEHFFSIEPMKTYRDYFTVSTAYAVSPESGVNGLTRFNSEYYGNLHGDKEIVLDYARTYGVGIDGNESNATIMVLMNTDVSANSTDLYDMGLAISWMGKSSDAYPYDQRGCVLHESVGLAFGKLGPETITHLTFLDACGCSDCNMKNEHERAQKNGWWKNVSNTNKLKSLPWYHLIFHDKYSSIVDVYEGACNHSRGAYRSESQSVMGNAYVHYFNTISRELLVRRIMECAGEDFDFEDFVSNDVIELPE